KARGLPARLGVDEKAVAKGHVYMTLVCDLETATIEHVAEDRKRASLEAYLEQFPADKRAGIKAIAMDMWAPYEEAVRAQVPQADDKIVFDLFHIMMHMNEAVDRTRRREQRELKAAGEGAVAGAPEVWGHGERECP